MPALCDTSAIATTAIAAGCKPQGVRNGDHFRHRHGRGRHNGKGSGGTDSPSAVTATYGANTNDSICTGDPSNALATPYPGLAPAACVPNATFTFSAVSTAPSFGNSDVLATSSDAISNSTTLDTASHVYLLTNIGCVDHLSTLHDLGVRAEYQLQPNGVRCLERSILHGWGFHWKFSTAQMFPILPPELQRVDDCEASGHHWNHSHADYLSADEWTLLPDAQL